jgi:hypothetical protein
VVRVAALTTAAIIPKSRPPCQFRLWQGGFFLTKIRLRKFKKLPEKSRGAFYFAEYARKHADFVGTTLLENLPRAGTGPRSGLDLGQRPSPLRAPVQSFALFFCSFFIIAANSSTVFGTLSCFSARRCAIPRRRLTLGVCLTSVIFSQSMLAK